MKTRKGLEVSAVGLVAVLLISVVVGGGAYMIGQDQESADTTQEDFDGQIQTFQDIQELTGFNDLDITEQSLSEDDQTVDDSNVVTDFDISDSDGDTLRFAYGLEVDDTLGEVDVELENEGVEDNLQIEEAKIVEDEDDEDTLRDAATVASFSPDEDDEFDEEVSELEDGDYAVVLEVYGSDTSGISTDQDLYTWNIEGDGDEDDDGSEEVHVTIDNADA